MSLLDIYPTLEELYDHRSDPREYTNLADQPDAKSVIARLSASLPGIWIPERRTKDAKSGKPGVRKATSENP